jgi:hypothetical protein
VAAVSRAAECADRACLLQTEERDGSEMIQLRAIASEIDGIMDSKANPVPSNVRERMVVQAMIGELESTGRLFSVDEMPVHLAPDGTVTDICHGDSGCIGFIVACGLTPGGTAWDKKLSDTLRSQPLPLSRIHGLAHYDLPKHTLYLNEWNKRFIRIGPDGKATRHVNGEFDLLFETADAAHDTDLELVNRYTGGALAWSDDDALVKHIFGVAKYSEESGIGRTNAITILLGFTLALMMSKRVKVVPVVLMDGYSGTRKSAVAQALGSVVSGDGMDFRVTSCPDTAKEVENVLINSRGVICLDEFQNPRALASLIKSVTTGGTIRRRILFTTSSEKAFTVDAALVLTINRDPLLDEATTKRFLRINMGLPEQDSGGWRGDIFVQREWSQNNVRERGWNELVCRLSAAMRLLSVAAEKREDDLIVNHRMSGFWSFLLGIAKQESPEVTTQIQTALTAISEEQSISLGTQDDLLPRLLAWLKAKPEFCRRWLSANEIGHELLQHWTMSSMGDGPGPEMRKILASSYLLSSRLRASQLYVKQLGLSFGEDSHRKVKTFRFDPPTDGSQNDDRRRPADSRPGAA